MSAKLIFMTSVLGIGGYVGHRAMTFDPAVVPLSQAQVETMLTDAVTTMPRRDDDKSLIRIWSTGAIPGGVQLKMQYASWAPVLDCKALITALAPDKTRVTTDCSSPYDHSGSAIARNSDQLQVPMFKEHVEATLGQRPFDRKRVDRLEMTTMFANLPAMQAEALKASDMAQREQAEAAAAR